MSLSAILAQPVRSRRRPVGRPRAAAAATEKDWLEAVRLRVVLKLTESKAAGALGITKPTLRDWVRKGYRLPQAKQLLSGDLD